MKKRISLLILLLLLLLAIAAASGWYVIDGLDSGTPASQETAPPGDPLP